MKLQEAIFNRRWLSRACIHKLLDVQYPQSSSSTFAIPAITGGWRRGDWSESNDENLRTFLHLDMVGLPHEAAMYSAAEP